MIIQAETVDIATPTGPMRTYVYRPVGDRAWPGVIFFSEIFQQTGPIERTARLFAGHGYVGARRRIEQQGRHRDEHGHACVCTVTG